jgi:hypothetical protein
VRGFHFPGFPSPASLATLARRSLGTLSRKGRGEE